MKKDQRGKWYYCYDTFRKQPPSGSDEKLVALNKAWIGNNTDQVWAYINRYNGI